MLFTDVFLFSLFFFLIVLEDFYCQRLFWLGLCNLTEVECCVILMREVVRDGVGNFFRGQIRKGFVCHVKEF